MHYLSCLALSAEEVANTVRMMFDQPLTDRGSEILMPFSSNSPPPEVIHCFVLVWA
jgi:hypothetical protein